MLEIDIITFETLESSASLAQEPIKTAASSRREALPVSSHIEKDTVASERQRIDYRESFLFGWRF